MGERPLSDAPARAAVRDDLDRCLVVEAGAGSGKTTAIIERIISTIATGTDLSQIVAVTFTEAAAADLRARLRSRLEGEIAVDSDIADVARWALTQLDAAAIGTLHSWARRIVAESPLELGLPPRFDVLDEIQTSIERSRSWRALFTDLLSDSRLSADVEILEAAGYRTAGLRAVYEEYSDNIDRILTAGITGDGPLRSVTVDVSEALRLVEVAVGYASSCRSEDDTLFGVLSQWRTLGLALRAATDDVTAFAVLCADWPRYGNAGRKANWDGGVDKATVVAALDDAKHALETERHRVVGAAVANITDRILEHVMAEAADRRREGALQFADLLVLACELLRTSVVARRRNHERTRVVIIDEFQDTDPLQAELAALVATDARDVADTPWWDLPVPAGSLVIVGDPKQSIYRFRRADLAVFRRSVEVHRSGHVTLTTNFRSSPSIIRWVDEIIGVELAEGASRDPDLQADHVPLEAYRDDTVEPAVRVFGDEHIDASIEEVRAAEAADIAALAAEIRSGTFLVRDSDGTEERPARLGDAAILLPTRLSLVYLEHALAEANIPVRIESQSLVLATEVVRELLVILEAATDPNDTVAVVAALRSPSFACRDDELARHALAGGTWNPLDEAPSDSPPAVTEGLAALAALHGEVLSMTVDGAVEHVIATCRILELGVAHRRPRDQWRRALYIADLARSFTDAGGMSLREFTGWLRERADADVRAVEVPVPEPDDDAIRVLTVHGAKGLEFPITILAGLNAEERTGVGAVLWSADGPVVTATKIRPPDYHEYYALEDRATVAEAGRLLYVAATRARDHLFVSLHRKHGASQRCPAVRIAQRCASSATPWSTWTPNSDTPAPPPPEKPAPFDHDAWRHHHEMSLQRGRGIAAVAATSLAALEHPMTPIVVEAESTSSRRGRAGTAIGRAVHATLQSVDLATAAGLEAVARAQAVAEGVSLAASEIETLARSALSAPIVGEALGVGRYWREVPVGAAIDGIVVEGFVDLLVETAEGLVVVDWKTDRIESRRDAQSRMIHYRIQGAAYALALEAALGRPVVRCVFVFTGTDGPLELEVEDLAGACSDARMHLHDLANR